MNVVFVKWSNTAGWKWLILQNSNSSGIATLGNKEKNPSYQLMITPNPYESYLYLSASYHYAINIADPSSMQDVCYMNFVIDHAHPWSPCGSVVEHWSAESEGLRFDSSWGLGTFSLSPTHEMTENIFLYYSFSFIISCLVSFHVISFRKIE